MKDNILNREIKPVERPSPSELLARVIDPSKDIKPIFENYYRKSSERLNKIGTTSYTPEQIDNLAKDMSDHFLGNIIDSSQYLSDMRVKATKLLEKGRIFIDSRYEKTAEKMLRQVVNYSRDWLEKNHGQSFHVPFNFSPDKVIEDVKLLIDDQSNFIETLQGKDNLTSKVSIYVPTHDPDISNDFIKRIDNGSVEIGITSEGNITKIGITELSSYTKFLSSEKDISIIILATDIPDDMASKFDFFGDNYSTGTLSGTKIKITGRQHDLGETQLWINCAPKPGTSKDDCLNLVKLWLKTVKEHPRILKPKK